MTRCNRVIEKIASIQLDFAAIAAALILLQVTADLILRYAFASPIKLSTEIVAYYYLPALVFLPLLAMEYHDHHITTDLFFDRLPRRMQGACLLAGSVLAVILYVVLAWFSLEEAISATQKREVVIGAQLLPIWPMRWILPFAFVMAALGAVLSMLRRITQGPGAAHSTDPEDSVYE